jgi:ribosome-binding protein aMBF1 (putative translation factor)
VPCAGQDTPFLCVSRANTNRKGDNVKCEFCRHEAPGLIILRVYTGHGIKVCAECYGTIDSHRHKPYSKVMDKLALLEAGHYVNRKMATLAKTRW